MDDNKIKMIYTTITDKRKKEDAIYNELKKTNSNILAQRIYDKIIAAKPEDYSQHTYELSRTIQLMGSIKYDSCVFQTEMITEILRDKYNIQNIKNLYLFPREEYFSILNDLGIGGKICALLCCGPCILGKDWYDRRFLDFKVVFNVPLDAVFN